VPKPAQVRQAAFLLPIIQKNQRTRATRRRVLVLAPTRELALQIQQNYGELNNVKGNRSTIVIGGANIRNADRGSAARRKCV